MTAPLTSLASLSLTVVAMACVCNVTAVAAEPQLVSRQSPALGGAPGDLDSGDPTLSGDGRLVAFSSDAHNLSDADTEDGANPHVGRSDVFVHDRASGETRLASPPGPMSYAPALSADGRWLVFASANEYHEPSVVNLLDLATGTLRGVGGNSTTIGYAYPQAPPVVSGDGRIVAFETEAGDVDAIAAYDRDSDSVRVIDAVKNGRFSGLSVSADGRVIAYSLLASGGNRDLVLVYRHEGRRKPRRIDQYAIDCCITNFGTYGTSLSADGRHLAYVGRRRGRASVIVHDARTGRRRLLSGRRSARDPSLDARGRFVTFTAAERVMVHDRRRRTTRVAASGAQGRISADGSSIAFAGVYTDPEQVFALPRP